MIASLKGTGKGRKMTFSCALVAMLYSVEHDLTHVVRSVCVTAEAVDQPCDRQQMPTPFTANTVKAAMPAPASRRLRRAP
jgi:hypothetical protein